MDLRDSLNRVYYDMTVSDLRQLSRSGGGDISYNSMMYLDVISFQQAEGLCTVSTLAKTLNVSKSAATIKVNELARLGLVKRTKSEKDRRVVNLELTEIVEESLAAYDRPFERAVRLVETQFSQEQIGVFCDILQTFSTEFVKELL